MMPFLLTSTDPDEIEADADTNELPHRDLDSVAKFETRKAAVEAAESFAKRTNMTIHVLKYERVKAIRGKL